MQLRFHINNNTLMYVIEKLRIGIGKFSIKKTLASGWN